MEGEENMENTKKLFYFPFCQENYWPTVYDAIDKMRQIRNRGHRIDVYTTLENAMHIAEVTACEGDTWIVVEIEVNNNKSVARLATTKDYADVDFDNTLVQSFRLNQTN